MADRNGWDHAVDLLIVGSGAGAMTAALSAHDRGASVLLVEKGDCYGGSSAMSGGALWIPNNCKMAEAGVDISKHTSKHVDDVMYVNFDYVVTVCSQADETCPVFPGKTWVMHVGFDDPPKLAQNATTEQEALSHYRRVRDEIKEFVSGLPGNLEPETAA